MTYFNTTKEKQLDLFVKINEGQDKQILELIKNHYRLQTFSSTEVFLRFKFLNQKMFKPMLMTSIRRSINTLMRAGYIEPTGERVMGLYGRKELQYRLV